MYTTNIMYTTDSEQELPIPQQTITKHKFVCLKKLVPFIKSSKKEHLVKVDLCCRLTGRHQWWSLLRIH